MFWSFLGYVSADSGIRTCLSFNRYVYSLLRSAKSFGGLGMVRKASGVDEKWGWDYGHIRQEIYGKDTGYQTTKAVLTRSSQSSSPHNHSELHAEQH